MLLCGGGTMEELRAERRRFEDALGMAPGSVNAHGLGTFRWAERMRFYREATAERLHAEGFAFSDMHSSLRAYDYVVEDCHVSRERRDRSASGLALTRCLMDDFTNPPGIRGTRVLVLTHPGYWSGAA